ncbi:ras-related protein Rab-38-like [Diorhabda carinulata]|uniref:ras-related protein Rab-38-like n=1 Tax=Diorhabda carinulata TaxID=1163345 RepID=UPI0025A284F8|nr:ras-related protein Rab-38-like [Diorhabda carinulata]
MNGRNGLTREDIIKINETIRENNLHKQELNFKIIVIGDFGVGKTSIIGRYTEGEFSTQYKITIGADFAVKTLEWDENTRINLHVWDIAGHERFGSLLSVFYRHAVAAAIVFDLTRPETFNSVNKWLLDLRKKIHMPGGKSIPIVILANKGDITTNTLPPEIDEFCRKNDILAWYTTSAKYDINIDEAMIKLTNAAITNHRNLQCSLMTDEDIISLSENSEVLKRDKCCS